jgi:tetratricopeptide (TPR) repeat protein
MSGSHTQTRTTLVLPIIVFLCLCAHLANAQTVRPVDRAVDAFNSGRYKEAIEHLLKAHALDPLPVYLFNIGRAHEESGDLRQAEKYFVLVENSDAPAKMRKRATAKAAEVRVRLAAQAENTTLHSAPVPDRPVRWAPWAATAGGVLTAAAGGVLYFMAEDLRASVAGAQTDSEGLVVGLSQDEAFSRRDRANDLAAAGTALGLAGTAVAVGAIAWALLDTPDNDQSLPTVGIMPADGATGLFFRFSF